MSTGIQWTDETWNPVVGCEQITPGCAHCYAKELHDKRHQAYLAGKRVAPQYAEPFETVQLKPERLDAPLRWKRPRRVFVNSVSDLFHDDVPDEYIAQVFAVMAVARRHTFQVLTKRPARMRALMSDPDFAVEVLKFVRDLQQVHDIRWVEWPLPNIWLGVSVENQRWANERIPLLVQTRAAVRFLSCEPLLGPIDFDEAGSRGGEDGDPCAFSALGGTDACDPPIPGIDWVIVGGESGASARWCSVDAVTDVVAQCDFAGVPCFVKQMGSFPVATARELSHWKCRASEVPGGGLFALELRDSHGGDPAEWPAELRVREFPASEVSA